MAFESMNTWDTPNDKKALEIFKEMLTPEQLATLTAPTKRRSQQYFDFDAHGRHFRIYNRYWYAVRELDDEGKVIKSICGHARRTGDRGYATMLSHYTQLKYFGLNGYTHILPRQDVANEERDY